MSFRACYYIVSLIILCGRQLLVFKNSNWPSEMLALFENTFICLQLLKIHFLSVTACPRVSKIALNGGYHGNGNIAKLTTLWINVDFKLVKSAIKFIIIFYSFLTGSKAFNICLAKRHQFWVRSNINFQVVCLYFKEKRSNCHKKNLCSYKFNY